MSRCVRQAFLLGVDGVSGRRFDHRKRWVLEEMATLQRVFAIDVCAYAVMSNHLHLVLRLDTDQAARWTAAEVVDRARRLFPHAVRLAEAAGPQEDCVDAYRARLSSLSWFMRCLNERIARRANREDGCTGRFWEGRFKCRPLLDVGALLTCMAYVDLNPTRAGLAGTLAEADFTSIQQRLSEVGRVVSTASPPHGEGIRCVALPQATGSLVRAESASKPGMSAPALLPFSDEHAGRDGAANDSIPFERAAYVELVRSIGMAAHPTKQGRLSHDAATLLHDVGLSCEAWASSVEALRSLRFAAIGERHLIDEDAQRRRVCRSVNRGWAQTAYRRRASTPSSTTDEIADRRAA
ncbi:MAG: hypothetical protein R3B40_08920 [Polyangiales bacterium]|nr:transposase [Sandaracinaceae bacterium]